MSGPDPTNDADGEGWETRLRSLDDHLGTLGVRVDDDAGEADPDAPDVTDPDAIADTDTDEAPVVAAGTGPGRARAVLDWIVVIGIALLVAFVVRTYVLAHFVVDGVSMASTLHDGDRVFVNKLSYRLHDPNRGDVVVLHELQGSGAERDLIKRVIALPGETVALTDCVVTIDGRLLDEPYLDPAAMTAGQCGADVTPLTIPADHVFVMGDNRGASMDSRDPSIGPVAEGDLVGRAFIVFWPRSSWQWL